MIRTKLPVMFTAGKKSGRSGLIASVFMDMQPAVLHKHNMV